LLPLIGTPYIEQNLPNKEKPNLILFKCTEVTKTDIIIKTTEFTNIDRHKKMVKMIGSKVNEIFE